ncbi:DUF6169 family protein [Chryseobacterium hagamense]|uniref:Uncharacterized protein n=1 Tax=Chryseobacterium hagamense TaxID=395935 RepID=A0A511YN53_9FLAO|nr:DUF6169 family protein [Chryseobacterium hagamense]GEN76632.1 hypothetical protein CHA01nite_23720 [Chryseobacterium hagamense]
MQSHYNYVFDSITNTYNFATKNNILYRVAFVVVEIFSTISGEEIPNIYQLIIEKATDELEPFDTKVSKTIEHIIERFFQKTENALIYVCSDEDERARIRHEIFDMWYRNSDYKNWIVKIDNIMKFNIKNEIQKLYTSFLFHKQNLNYEKLIQIYTQIENVLNEEK